MRGLQTAALIILAVVFLARTPSAVREPRSRLSWLASGAGTLALLTLGTAIPQTVLDGWIGVQNWLNLVQNVLCTVAFWLVAEAAISQDGRRRTLRWWPLLAALAEVEAAVQRRPLARRSDEPARLALCGGEGVEHALEPGRIGPFQGEDGVGHGASAHRSLPSSGSAVSAR